uniref:Secreted protein n=1 Tax=Hydra vulgaris TaxID=6087 RepID=B3VQ09_HYDVU|nr:secreted protein [Hydra vulgaris]
MTRVCVFLLCVAFFALIDARPKTARLKDSKKSSELVKLNDPSFGQKIINRIKKPFEHVINSLKNGITSKKETKPPRRCYLNGYCSPGKKEIPQKN